VKARRVIIAILLFSFLGAVMALGINGCTSSFKEKETPNLETIEIREYQGENLSSINDFRENSIAGPQYIDKDEYRLTISGLVNNPLSITYDDVINQYQSQQKVIKLDCVEGWSVTILWEGVSIKDLIQPVGVKPEAKVVIFRSYDGYSTALPLEYVIDRDIILAYKMNGVTMPPEHGFPFQVVAESKWGYKWAKWVTEIELSNDTSFRGYWEERGYSNDGDLDKEFFDY
jgi:DMSO/TMAO reductase YedYZ molybdopterin-dependent catalytic subunit